jgi:hypothetical protein
VRRTADWSRAVRPRPAVSADVESGIECLTKGERYYKLGRAVEHDTIYCVCGLLDRVIARLLGGPLPRQTGGRCGSLNQDKG